MDAEKLGLTDYHTVVKLPMDLGTVLSNLMKVVDGKAHYEGVSPVSVPVKQVN